MSAFVAALVVGAVFALTLIWVTESVAYAGFGFAMVMAASSEYIDSTLFDTVLWGVLIISAFYIASRLVDIAFGGESDGV